MEGNTLEEESRESSKRFWEGKYGTKVTKHVGSMYRELKKVQEEKEVREFGARHKQKQSFGGKEKAHKE